MLLASVALRLLESSGTTWWLITVPEGAEWAVANELQAELEMHVDTIHIWPGQPPDTSPDITLFVVMGEALDQLPPYLDRFRSGLAKRGVIAFILTEANAATFLSAAPHVASFIGGKVLATSTDDVPPPEFIERRLASLRSTYGMTDEQAHALFKAMKAPDTLDFLEWMVLVGARPKASPDGE